VNGAKAGETFWETSETVDGIEERRVSIFTERFDVKLHLLDSLKAGAHAVVIVSLEGDGVAKEVNSVFL